MENAARTIQRYWRNNFSKRTTVKLVQALQDSLNFTQDRVKSISFEALVILLREQPIIKAAKAVLQRIHLQSTFRHGSPSRSIDAGNVNVRVFLAANMIAYRPSHVFESMGQLEQPLFESSVPLLNMFHGICNALLACKCFAQVPSTLTKEFPTALFEYLKRFKAWKVPDEAKLTCRIKHALVALYQAEQHLPPDEPEDSKLRVEFRAQIERLRGKLQQIAGPEALAKFDEDRLSGGPMSSGGGGYHPDGSGGAGGAYAALPGRMTNEQLAHELLVDPRFRLDESGGCGLDNPVFQRIRESFHQAFWNSLVDDLKLATPCYVRVLRVLTEIRDGLADLAGENSITEIIDIEFIKHRIDGGSFSFKDAVTLFTSIVAVMQRMQARFRDEETTAKWGELKALIATTTADTAATVICKCLEFLLDRVNAMRIDAANARLRLIAPVIADHGVDYERGKFNDKLREGTLTVDRTTSWMRRVLGANPLLSQQILDGSRVAAVGLHAAAMVSLVSDGNTTAITPQTIPETLLFDTARLAFIKSEISSLISAKAVLAVVSTSKNAALIEGVRAAINTGEPLDIDTLGLPEAVKKMALEIMYPTDAVRTVLRARSETFLRQCIVHGVPDNVDDIFPTGATRMPQGFIDRAAKLVKSLCKVAVVNRNVHLETYNMIITHYLHHV